MRIKLFITGTDTNIGKTYISAGILSAFNNLGLSTLGIKPLASGCRRHNNHLFSDDTLALQKYSSIKLQHDVITPFTFEPPIAPHIAAELTGCELTVEQLNQKSRHAFEYNANVSVIEGCGGWCTPLNHTETMADFVISNHLKVILVVGVRLGCINHSLLSYRAIQHDGVGAIGWIANCIDPEMECLQENLISLKALLPIPCLGVVGHRARPEKVLDANRIIELAR